MKCICIHTVDLTMLGIFQQSSLRIEIRASEADIRDSLTQAERLQTWLWPQQLSVAVPKRLSVGESFTSWLGPVAIRHEVAALGSNGLRLLLSQGVDGYHDWYWGDGWVQSTLEGVSILPLNLGHTASLMRLRYYLEHPVASNVAS
jgi:hypothetical protein